MIFVNEGQPTNERNLLWFPYPTRFDIHRILLLIDVTNKQSFENVEMWLSEVNKYGSGDVNKLLVGNKSDLTSKREVETEKGKELAESNGMKFLETSAKTAENVEEAFLTMTREVFQQ